MIGAGLSPGGHSSLSATTTVSSATPTSPLPMLSPRKASLKRVSNVGFRCISPQPGSCSPAVGLGSGAAATASQTTPPAAVKLVAPSPVKMSPSPPSSSVLTLCPENQPSMSDGDSTQSDRPATCDMNGLITRNGERDETAASEINITRDYSNQDKSAGTSSVATTISSTKGAYCEQEAAATTNNSTAHINHRGSLFNLPNNTGGRTEALGLGSADSLATNWSVLCDIDKVNRPIKVNNHLEHGPCVSNTSPLSEGFSDPLLAPSSCSADQTTWQNKDLLTCREPRIGRIDVKLETDSVHLSQEKVHPEQAGVTASQPGRGFSRPQRHHEQTASLFTLQDHPPSGSSSSTSFTGLSTQLQVLSHPRPESSLPARPTTNINSTGTTFTATTIAQDQW